MWIIQLHGCKIKPSNSKKFRLLLKCYSSAELYVLTVIHYIIASKFPMT